MGCASRVLIERLGLVMGNAESREQIALFLWLDLMSNRHQELNLAFHIPNGGHRHVAVARKLKSEGVKPGVPDIFLPVPRGEYFGLFIELKAAKGKPSGYQQWWISELNRMGYRSVICHGFESAKKEICEYLGI